DSEVSTRLRERIAERSSAKRRARRTRMGIIGGGLTLGAALVWVVAASPLLALNLDNLDITGTTSYVSGTDVHAALADYEGVPLARLNTGEIRDRLRENHAIKEVQFARDWPTGLSVAIEARTPVAATPTDDGFVILDGEGT